MEAIVTDPLIPEGARQGEALRQFRHALMESRIEARDLRQVRKARRHPFNALDLTGQVQGGKSNQSG